MRIEYTHSHGAAVFLLKGNYTHTKSELNAIVCTARVHTFITLSLRTAVRERILCAHRSPNDFHFFFSRFVSSSCFFVGQILIRKLIPHRVAVFFLRCAAWLSLDLIPQSHANKNFESILRVNGTHWYIFIHTILKSKKLAHQRTKQRKRKTPIAQICIVFYWLWFDLFLWCRFFFSLFLWSFFDSISRC